MEKSKPATSGQPSPSPPPPKKKKKISKYIYVFSAVLRNQDDDVRAEISWINGTHSKPFPLSWWGPLLLCWDSRGAVMFGGC